METNATELPRVYLKAGGDRRVSHGYPWVFSNEVRMDAETKGLRPGGLVTIHRVDGKALGVGSFNPHTLIAFRLFARDPDAQVDADFIGERIGRALRLRGRCFARPFYRLIHAEADGLPGLIVDRFADHTVVQVNTAGMELLTPLVLDALDAALKPHTVVLRNDSPARTLEGLAKEVRMVKGALAGPVDVAENGLTFRADLLTGQKTGWFYDQSANRQFVAPLAARGSMLDLFCHSGGFAITAAAAGAADVLAVDTSRPALALANDAAAATGVADRCTFQEGDVFASAESLARTSPRHYQMVVADPPAFAKSRKDLPTALKGYRKLARLTAALVRDEGFLFLASCSHVVTPAMFADEVAAGLQRANRSGRILRAAGAGPDHPVHPLLRETDYLKSLLIQLD